MSGRASNRPPLSPKEAWISDGRQVLHFRPSRWDRWSKRLEVTVGELLPDQPVPLLKKRLELSREADGCRRTERCATRIRPEPCGVCSARSRKGEQGADVAPVCLLESGDVLLPQG